MSCLYENNDDIFDVLKLEDGTFLVKVSVKDFSGRFIYCIEDDNLNNYIASLEKLDSKEHGSFKLLDMDSDSYIDFEKTQYGHMKISGQLGLTFRNNYLMFEMDADQTVIPNLIKRLK